MKWLKSIGTWIAGFQPVILWGKKIGLAFDQDASTRWNMKGWGVRFKRSPRSGLIYYRQVEDTDDESA